MEREKEGRGKKRETEIKEEGRRGREKEVTMGSIKTVRATKPQGNSVCGDEELGFLSHTYLPGFPITSSPFTAVRTSLLLNKNRI